MLMDQLEKNQALMREDMLTMRALMVQLMKAIQAMARHQEDLRKDNLRVADVNPPMTLPVNPQVGTNPPIMTQPPPEGGPVNHNVGDTFNIPVNGGDQPEIDDPHDAFFIPKVYSAYDTFGP